MSYLTKYEKIPEIIKIPSKQERKIIKKANTCYPFPIESLYHLLNTGNEKHPLLIIITDTSKPLASYELRRMRINTEKTKITFNNVKNLPIKQSGTAKEALFFNKNQPRQCCLIVPIIQAGYYQASYSPEIIFPSIQMIKGGIISIAPLTISRPSIDQWHPKFIIKRKD